MALRVQKAGNQKPWTLEELREVLQHFYKEHGRYPTTPEIDSYPYLPSSRSVQRRFGGALGLRKTLGLTGQHDFREGAHSKERAETINKRAHTVEAEVYKLLTAQFGKEFVHREYFFTDDRRTRADFFVYDKKQGFCVDVFYPSNRRNLIGCMNNKLQKYRSPYMREYPVIFLQMNPDITEEEVRSVVQNKKEKLENGQTLMGIEEFKDFCKGRKSLRLSKV